MYKKFMPVECAQLSNHKLVLGVFSEIFSHMIWSKFHMFSKYLNRKRRNISFIVQNFTKFTA